MDYFKVEPKDVLFNDLNEAQLGTLLKIQSITALLEREPTEQELLKYIHKSKLKALTNAMQTHHKPLSNYIQTLLKAITIIQTMRDKAKNKMAKYREKQSTVTSNVTGQIREDKIREDKITEDKKEREAHFVRPAFVLIKTYWAESGLKGDPEEFFNYYESNGWQVGRAKMKDWKAAARNWSSRETQFRKTDEGEYIIGSKGERLKVLPPERFN